MDAIPIVEREYVLVEKIDETPEVLIIKFAPADGKPSLFDPGMFMMIIGIDSSGRKYTARAFSIASDPATPMMEFMIIKQPTHGDHIGTSHFVDAKAGDRFILRGPNGQFRYDPRMDRKVLFIAGGTGLAPFISMLRHIRMTNSQIDAVLMYSVKFPTEIIAKNELNGYANGIGLKLLVTVTRPERGDGWAGKTGHIDANMITGNVPDYSERTPYICGPLAFVKAVKDALTSLGVPANNIKADVWG